MELRNVLTSPTRACSRAACASRDIHSFSVRTSGKPARDKETKGFEVLPKRWIVERTFGWLRRDRRLAKDYERKVQTSETLTEVASDPAHVTAL